MKISKLVCLAVVLSLAPLAIAKLSLSKDLLGKTEGLLDGCAKVDTASAAKYEARKKAITRDASEQELTDARASEEYKSAYDLMASGIEQMPKEEVVKACPAALKNDK
jgi:hypothetical protein